MRIPGMGKRAATKLLDAGDVTWEGLREMLDNIDFDCLDRPSRLASGMRKSMALGVLAAASAGRKGPVTPGGYLLARNVLREFGPPGRKVTT